MTPLAKALTINLRTRGAKPRQDQRHELSPLCPPTCNQIGSDRDVRDTIEAKCHAQEQFRTPKRWGGALSQITLAS